MTQITPHAITERAGQRESLINGSKSALLPLFGKLTGILVSAGHRAELLGDGATTDMVVAPLP